MTDKMLRALSEFSMLEYGDRVVVALSGGADSVALLHVLNSIKEKYNLTIYVCHLNHLIREGEADRDEQFVKSLCETLGIELFVKRVDVTALAKEQKISLELCGRNVRYEFFSELADKLSAKIATAHTASDNVETVLYNLTRGTSVTGLCGIRPVRDNIIRPLILATRAEVEQYCSEHGLSYVTDSTNLTDDYTRNNIRHNAVPTLAQINADLEGAVSRMCASMADIKDYIDKISIKEIKSCKTEHGYSCKKLFELDNAILSNALFLICKECDANATNRHIELIIEAMKNGGCVDLLCNKRVVCKQGILRVVDTALDSHFDAVKFKYSDDFAFISEKELKNINKKLLNNCISCDIITDGTVLRTRCEGDTFTLADRDVTKSLKKLLNELKIPAEKRSSLKVVANGSDVLWLEGVGVSKQGRVKAHSSGAYIYTGGKNE